MREDGARLTGENANFDAFAVLIKILTSNWEFECLSPLRGPLWK